ncbi:MAG: hypothetical protein ACLFVQ_02480 [Chitinispirillaceae bacterium]
MLKKTVLRILTAVSILLTALTISCAGGFGTDSDSANELADPIFGSDSAGGRVFEAP